MLHYWNYKRLLPAYASDALSALRSARLGRHVTRCRDCQRELGELARAGKLLRRMPLPQAPGDLDLQIRLRLSRERNRQQRPSLLWRLENLVAPFALQGALGIAAAVAAFATFLPLAASPVQASSEDVPIALRTPPRLRSSAPMELNAGLDHTVVEILIDQEGRVADYSVVAGMLAPEDLRRLENQLLFTVFHPATLFGRPTAGKLVLSFRHVRVQG